MEGRKKEEASRKDAKAQSLNKQKDINHKGHEEHKDKIKHV